MELTNPNANVAAILPELVVAITGVVVMLYDSFVPKQRTVTAVISLAGLAVSGVLLAMMWNAGGDTGAWNGMILNDSLRMSFSFVFLFVTAITILVSTVWVE